MTLEALFEAIGGDEALWTATTAVADGEQASAPLETRMPGPGIGVGTRVIPGGESEVEVELGQSFPLGGARRALRAAREAEAGAIREDGAQRRLRKRYVVARHFYDAVHHRERLEVVAGRRAELESAHAALKRREEAGDASAFEVERMGRELRQVALRQSREQLAFDAALLDIEAEVPGAGELTDVVGALAPASCGAQVEGNPKLRALEHRVAAGEFEAKAARSGNSPELETRAGWAAVLGPDEFAQGFVAGIGLRVPFWGYGDFAEDRAVARTAALAAEKQLLEREISGRARRATARCEKLLELAAQAETSVDATSKLVARATAGYSAAELSLLELVDAQRALLDDRLERLELLAEARAAELAWRLETGGWR